MTLIVVAEILFSTSIWFAAFWMAQRSRINPFFDWRILGVLAVTFSQLLILAVVTALWDFKKSVRWLLILAILIAESASLSSVMVMTSPTPMFESILSEQGAGFLLLVLASAVGGTLGLILTIGVASVLLLHVLLWPVRNMLGWRIHWAGETFTAVKPQYTLWHLFVWTALIGVLLSLGRTLAASDSWMGMTTFLFLWGIAALLTGFPALVVATRRQRFMFWMAAGVAWLTLLSFVESELTFALTKSTGTGSWLPLWLMALCNGIVAVAVLLHVLMLGWLGIVFDLPLPFSMTNKTSAVCPVTEDMSSGG